MVHRIAFVALALWLVTIAGLGWVFVKGNTRASTDGRTAIVLAAADRDFVLAEMRQMLQAVRGVTTALAAGDGAAAAEAARAAGGAATHHVPPTLMAALPAEFKHLGLGMHRGFDDLAAAAEPVPAQLQRLSALLSLCVSCHQAYRLEPAR
ncbi:MAG: hypothetical protein HY985_02225 [Magnetospirillum sp.]|nr:hypothetical protein [Magnetospirillum sp.]